MPTGTFQGTFKVSGTGITFSAGGVLAAAGVAYALINPKRADEVASGAFTAAAITAGVVIAAAVTVIGVIVYLRLRERSTPRIEACPVPDTRPGIRWQQNPNAIPVRPRREIAAPVVTVNIDAGLLAGLMNAMQQQPVRVTAEPVEQQEIPR